MHVEEIKTKRQFPIKTRTLQMSAMKNETFNKSFNLIRSGKDTYPYFSQGYLCNFMISMTRETEKQLVRFCFVARSQKTVNTLFLKNFSFNERSIILLHELSQS